MALPPSSTNSRTCSGSSPRSMRLASRALHTVLFSVPPSHRNLPRLLAVPIGSTVWIMLAFRTRQSSYLSFEQLVHDSQPHANRQSQQALFNSAGQLAHGDRDLFRQIV